jgi:hypothetical protein
MEIKESAHKVPQWLKKLQENSWELELLISGRAIFSLFQLTDVFFKLDERLRRPKSDSGNAADDGYGRSHN